MSDLIKGIIFLIPGIWLIGCAVQSKGLEPQPHGPYSPCPQESWWVLCPSTTLGRLTTLKNPAAVTSSNPKWASLTNEPEVR